MEKEKPPVLGLIQRGGQVVLRMLANVQQKTIQPIIEATVAKGARIHTDEYDIYARLPSPLPSFQVAWNRPLKALQCASILAKRVMSGTSLCSGMVGMRS
ncbi:MAG: transposase, partial [Geminicoccaceae bacterium]